MKIAIRKADLSDIDQVHTFLNRFFALDLEGISLRPDGMTREQVQHYIPKNTTSTNKLCLIAQNGNQIVGKLSFQRYEKLEYRDCGRFRNRM